MGLLGSLFGSVQKNLLQERFGIRRPGDAVRVLEQFAERYRRDDEYDNDGTRQAYNAARSIGRWLRSLSVKPGSEGDEAKKTLDKLNHSYYGDFFKEHGII